MSKTHSISVKILLTFLILGLFIIIISSSINNRTSVESKSYLIDKKVLVSDKEEDYKLQRFIDFEADVVCYVAIKTHIGGLSISVSCLPIGQTSLQK